MKTMTRQILISVLIVLLFIPSAHASLTVTSFKCNDKVALSIETGSNINCAVRIQNNDGSSSATVNTIRLTVSGSWADESSYSMALNTQIPASQSIERTFEGIRATTTGSDLKFSNLDIDGTGHAEEITSASVNSMSIKTTTLTTSDSSIDTNGEFDAYSSVSVGGNFNAMSLTLGTSGCSLKSGESATKDLGSMANNAMESRSWKVVQGSGATCTLTATATGSTDAVTLTKTKSSSVTNPNPTVSASSSSGSGASTASSSGGAAAGSSQGSAVIKTVTPSNTETITSVILSLKKSILNPKITVETLQSTPASVPTPEGTIYKYMTITKNNLNATDLNYADIEFKVSKSWLTSESISTVYLARYNNGWNKLETSLLLSADDFNTYRARTTGFSYFAIIGEKSQPSAENTQSEPEKKEPTPETKNIPPRTTAQATEAASSSNAVTYILAVVLVVALILIYFVMKKKEKPSKPEESPAQPKPPASAENQKDSSGLS